MNKYKVVVVVGDSEKVLEFEALRAGINHAQNVIEAVASEGELVLTKIDSDWDSIRFTETVPQAAPVAVPEPEAITVP